MSEKGIKNHVPAGRKRFLLWFALLFMLAFLLRLIFLLQFKETTFFHSTGMDSLYYLKWAACIRDGVPFINEAYFMGPLYPFFLSLLMRFMGSDVFLFTLVQIVIGSLTVCLTAWIGLKVFQFRTGWIAGLIAALYIPFIFFEGLILMVTVYTFLGLLALYLSWQAMETEKPALFFLTGLILGLAALARANILGFGCLFMLWIFVIHGKRGWRKALFLAIGMFLVVAPVTLRNYRVEGVFVPITSNGGLNFYIGNNENANGLYVPLDHLPLTMNNERGVSIDGFNDPTGRRFSELYMERPLTSSEVSSFWMNEGLEFIRTHPGRFMSNTAMKMAFFWNAYEIPQIENFYYIRKLVPFLRLPLLQFMTVAPLGILGLFLSWKQRKKYAVFYLYVLAYFLSIMPFFVTSRYRLPVLPCLILFAAHAVTLLWQQLKSPDVRQTVFHGTIIIFILFPFTYVISQGYVVITVLSLFLLVFYYILSSRQNRPTKPAPVMPGKILALGAIALAVNLPLHQGNFGMAESINNFGRALVREERFEEAIRLFELALSYNPEDPVVHYNLGTTHARLGHLDRAEAALTKTVEINPSSYSAWLNLSNIYHIKGLTDRDMEVQQKLIQLNPKNYKAYFHMGNILSDRGEYRASLAYYRQAADRAPDESYIFSNLATVLYRLGEYEEASDGFRQALALQEAFEQGARQAFEKGGPTAPSEEERRHYKASLNFNLAVVAEKLGEIEKAMAYCRAALEIRPDYARARQLLAELASAPDAPSAGRE
jgi:tetratricopeptide (TPR) repeat protein